MIFFRGIICRLHEFLCNLWNHQYFQYQNISSSVVFAASYPGIVRILSPLKCSIGPGTVINAGAVIHCAGEVKIGRFVHVGHGLCVYSSNHNYASENSIPYDSADVLKAVVIGDFVWIGANVSVLPGVTIGEGAIVGMGSVVTRDVPVGAISAGNPARVIGWRNMELFHRLKDEGRFA